MRSIPACVEESTSSAVWPASRLPDNPRLDLFHGLAEGGVAEVALGDLQEAGAGPAGLEELEIFEWGNAVV